MTDTPEDKKYCLCPNCDSLLGIGYFNSTKCGCGFHGKSNKILTEDEAKNIFQQTMSKPPENSRRLFEEWGKDKFNSFKIDPEDGEYFWIDAQVAWEAWQAALQSIPPNKQ